MLAVTGPLVQPNTRVMDGAGGGEEDDDDDDERCDDDDEDERGEDEDEEARGGGDGAEEEDEEESSCLITTAPRNSPLTGPATVGSELFTRTPSATPYQVAGTTGRMQRSAMADRKTVLPQATEPTGTVPSPTTETVAFSMKLLPLHSEESEQA